MEKELQYSLLSGVPIEVEKVGKIYPLTLKEIGVIGEKKYGQYLSLLTLDKSVLKGKINLKLEDLSAFDILTLNSYYNEEFREEVEIALATFLREVVTFIPEYLIFFVGEVTEQRFIHQDNFDEIIKIIKLQNKMKDREVQTNDKKLSKKAQQLLKKREQGRQLLQKARGEDDITLTDLISALGVYTQDINSVLNWTVYQLHDQYQKFIKRENYYNNFEMFLVGADPKKLNLEKHWTSK